MIQKHEYQNLSWLDLLNPDKKDIESIIQQYNIPKDAAENLLSPTPKQRVSVFPNCVYVVLHFPKIKLDKEKDQRQEIDFIIGKEFLITVHYDSVKSISKFSKLFKSNSLFENENENVNAGHIFHKLVKHLYHYILHDVENIKNALNRTEVSIFTGEEKKMVVQLSNIHRDILRFKNALLPHEEALDSLQIFFKDFLGDEYVPLVNDMFSEYKRIDRRMKNNKDVLDELRLTNDSLLSAKQNEAIKGLTMMAFVTFPLSLVASIFGMDTKMMPIKGHPNDFLIIISIMLFIVLASIVFFRYKKWL